MMKTLAMLILGHQLTKFGWIEEGEEIKKEVKKEERVKEEDQDSLS